MIDVLSLPVEEPGSFIFFIFIPGFLVYYGLLLGNKSGLIKISFFETSVFSKHVDAVIWSLLFGITLSMVISVIAVIFSFFAYMVGYSSPVYDKECIYKSTAIGIVSLALSMAIIFGLLTLGGYIKVKLTHSGQKVMYKRTFGLLIIAIVVISLAELLLIKYLCSPNPITGDYRSKFVPYHSNNLTAEKKVVLDGNVYENVQRKSVVVVNPREYPITFWVGDENRKAKTLYRYINSSAVKLVTPQILGSKKALDFNVLIEDCDTKKEGRLFIFTSEGMIPLKYSCG